MPWSAHVQRRADQANASVVKVRCDCRRPLLCSVLWVLLGAQGHAAQGHTADDAHSLESRRDV